MKLNAVAVMAGTPVDTRMGMDFLESRGIETKGFPTANNPVEQTRFQTSSTEEREAVISGLLEEIKADGINKVFVYCNSLSATVDFPRLAAVHDIKIVTPLDVYSLIAPRYSLIGVMAANNQSLAGIERVMLAANPSMIMIGHACLKIINEIEKGLEPSEIIRINGIDDLAKSFEKCGTEILVLGCTHHPYLKEEIEKITSLEIVDPAEEMLKLLVG